MDTESTYLDYFMTIIVIICVVALIFMGVRCFFGNNQQDFMRKIDRQEATYKWLV